MKPTLANKATVLVALLYISNVWCAAPVVSVEQQTQQAHAATQQAEQQQAARDQVIADMQIQITSLQEEIRQLRGTIEEQDYKVTQLLERQRELYRDLDQRLTDLNSRTSTAALTASPSNAQEGVTASAASPVASGSKPVKAESGKVSAQMIEQEQGAYDAIFPLVRNKQYTEAIKSYQDFLAAYPTGKNAPNARYWLGQIYNVINQLEEADTQFKLVVTQYPDSSKAHEALLKLGEIARKRGLNDAAKGFFQRVLQQYPDSPSSRVAQQKLQEMK